jgi:hypothetical protein
VAWTAFCREAIVDKRVLVGGLCAVPVLAVALWPSARPVPIDTRSWGLAQFLSHLQAAGLPVHVVPVSEKGPWGNAVYLSEDPEATWRSFQHKNRSVERIDQWHGAVWVEHLAPQGYTEWDVAQWGCHGCQIGRFVVFGDARLVERILQACHR